MERSAIRDGRYRQNDRYRLRWLLPGLRFAPSGLRIRELYLASALNMRRAMID
jgi:hypothetical protein